MYLSRHKSRILIVQSLYSWEINKVDRSFLLDFYWYKYSNEDRNTLLQYPRLLLTGVLENLKEIDDTIKRLLDRWDFARLALITLAILRLGVYELLFRKETPKQVVINEAIEIAKLFDSTQSFRIVNGVLDELAKSISE